MLDATKYNGIHMHSKPDLDFFEVFPWNQGFEVGIQAIDEQHKQLVVLINRLVNTLIYKEPEDVSQAFSELADYAHFHFETEETIWKENLQGDVRIESHQHNHASFLPAVESIQQQNAGKPLHEIIEDILRFLTRWLAFHIIDDDKRMALAIKALKSGYSIEQAKHQADKQMDGSAELLIDIVLSMYDGLASRTLNLMRERQARIAAETKLKQLNQKLESLSITDQLTGLFNRRHFETIFETELKRARQEQKSLNFYLLDIDYFKRLNDRYGHASGDMALYEIGKQLLHRCQHSADWPFRLGGEEFAIISVTDIEDDGLHFAQTICDSIAALGIKNQDSETADTLTVSVGAIYGIPQPDSDRNQLFKRVDACLYKAKSQGRNRVVYQT